MLTQWRPLLGVLLVGQVVTPAVAFQTLSVAAIGDSSSVGNASVQGVSEAHLPLTHVNSSTGFYEGSADAWSEFGTLRVAFTHRNANAGLVWTTSEGQAQFKDTVTVSGGTGTGSITFLFEASSVGTAGAAHNFWFYHPAVFDNNPSVRTILYSLFGDPEDRTYSVTRDFTFDVPFSFIVLLSADARHISLTRVDSGQSQIRLSGIEIRDASGVLVPGAAIVADSGTDYLAPPVPTVSEWGLAIMALFTLGAGTVLVRQRLRVKTAG